jgi:DNA-binding response OmpR family regulator
MPGPIILVVDDDPGIQQMLKLGLGRAGCRPVFCRSAARVPRHARRLRPAAVVLDAVLGRGLNGFQICAILKQEPATRGIPVLMTSGVLPAENSAREAARLGAAGFIKKAELWPALLRELDVLLRPSRAPDPGSALSSAETVRAGAVLIVDDQEEWLEERLAVHARQDGRDLGRRSKLNHHRLSSP